VTVLCRALLADHGDGAELGGTSIGLHRIRAVDR